MADTTYRLILLRHGESEWNQKNLFTGWVDVDLTEKGESRGRPRRRAARRGTACCPTCCTPRCCAARSAPRSSRWTRPTATGSRSAAAGGSTSATTARCRARTRRQTLAEFGEEQFMLWRRSYDTPPPPLADGSEFSPGRRRRATPTCPSELRPRTECLKDVVDRMLPYWYDAIVPDLRGRQDRPGHRARQLACGRWSSTSTGSRRRRHRRPQHPHRHPALYELDADFKPVAAGRPLPGPGRRRRGHRGREEPGQEVSPKTIRPPTGARGAGGGPVASVSARRSSLR